MAMEPVRSHELNLDGSRCIMTAVKLRIDLTSASENWSALEQTRAHLIKRGIKASATG